MPHICFDETKFYFPPVEQADEEGLLLIGGTVTPARIIEGYKKGIFPWYSEAEFPLWWSPDPRFVLFPDELHISRSMQKILSKNLLEFRIDSAFEDVIHHCATAQRKGQHGTWLTHEMKEVYNQLHNLGYAHSAEIWNNGKLIGGMYGIQLGNIFFGESMFSKEPNASKAAFIKYVQHLHNKGTKLIDCQVYTEHVESLGGRFISRKHFIQILEKEIS